MQHLSRDAQVALEANDIRWLRENAVYGLALARTLLLRYATPRARIVHDNGKGAYLHRPYAPRQCPASTVLICLSWSDARLKTASAAPINARNMSDCVSQGSP